MIRLISCDLDGTLLDHQARIRPQSARLLSHLCRAGVKVVLASGRSWRTTLKIHQSLGLEGPIIAHNGAYAFDPHTGQDLYRRTVPAERVRSIVRWANQQNLMIRLYLGQHQHVFFNRFDLAHQLCWLRREDRIVPHLDDVLTEDALEIFFTGLDLVDAFVHAFGSRGTDFEMLTFPHTGYKEANICAPGVDKVEALSALCREWGVLPGEVLALGDGANDEAMLAWSGTAVAVGDGSPVLRNGADLITSAASPEPVYDGLIWAMRQGLLPPVCLDPLEVRPKAFAGELRPLKT